MNLYKQFFGLYMYKGAQFDMVSMLKKRIFKKDHKNESKS